jgi:hypothetical protein
MIKEHELELLGALKEKNNLGINWDDKEYDLYFELRKKMLERVAMIFNMHKQIHHCIEAYYESVSTIVQPFEREVWVYRHYEGYTKVIGYPFDLILEADIIKLRKRLETLIF